MSANKRRAYDSIFGMVLGLLLMVPIMNSRGYFDPVPFSYVSTDEVAEEGGILYLSATFTKTDQCIFEKLGVFGESLGAWRQLRWEDVDGPSGDRIEGQHTLRLAIDVRSGPYTTIEIRTRHDCHGRKKDSIFLSLTP